MGLLRDGQRRGEELRLSRDDVTEDQLERFVADPKDGVFRGPFVRLRLPFRPAEDAWRQHLDWDRVFTLEHVVRIGRERRVFLRESFTLPGVSLTGTYGRIGRTAFGDPVSGGTHGFFDGAVSDLRLDLAATKRLGLVGLTAGVGWDRLASVLTAGFRDGPGALQVEVDGQAVHERWSAWGNASWTLLIFHASAEVGWQEAPVPAGLPSGVAVDPVGWFAGVAFRVSI